MTERYINPFTDFGFKKHLLLYLVASRTKPPLPPDESHL